MFPGFEFVGAKQQAARAWTLEMGDRAHAGVVADGLNSEPETLRYILGSHMRTDRPHLAPSPTERVVRNPSLIRRRV